MHISYNLHSAVLGHYRCFEFKILVAKRARQVEKPYANVSRRPTMDVASQLRKSISSWTFVPRTCYTLTTTTLKCDNRCIIMYIVIDVLGRQ